MCEILVSFLSLDVNFDRPAGTTSWHTVTFFFAAVFRVGVVVWGLWGTVTLSSSVVLWVGFSFVGNFLVFSTGILMSFL